MLDLLIYTLLLLVSFYLLANVSENHFIPALERIANRYNLTSDAAGATLMAAGSSAPELFIVIIAIITPGEHVDIGIGTIVGSALFNLLIISGTIAVVRTAVLSKPAVIRDLSFYTAAILLLLAAFYDGSINVIEAALFVGLYLVYLFVITKFGKWFPEKQTPTFDSISQPSAKHKIRRPKAIDAMDRLLYKIYPRSNNAFLSFSFSIVVIAILCWLLVESAIHISHILNVHEAIIALIVLAIGTSIPDWISSLVVAKQNKGGMAFSNAVGSNVFDILLGLGAPWLLLIALTGKTVIEVNTNQLFLSVFILSGSVVVILILLIINKWRIGFKTGIVLILLYLAYVLWEIFKIFY